MIRLFSSGHLAAHIAVASGFIAGTAPVMAKTNSAVCGCVRGARVADQQVAAQQSAMRDESCSTAVQLL